MSEILTRIDDKRYRVKVQLSKPAREVLWSGEEWTCACPEYKASSTCEHTQRAEISASIRKLATPKDLQGYDSSRECFHCHSSNVKKHSIRHNKTGDLQRYICGDCGRRYSYNPHTHDAHMVIKVMEHHFAGKSQVKTEMFIRKSMGLTITHQTISVWIQRYTEAMKSYLVRTAPTLSREWNVKLKTPEANKTFMKARMDTAFLYSLIDDETKFWLAKEIWMKQENQGNKISERKAKCIEDFNKCRTSILHV